jgi:anti-anti-sigma factor
MTIEFEAQDTWVIVNIVEIDRSNVDEFRALLRDAFRRYERAPRPTPGRCTTSMLIDLSRVRFLDCSAVKALVDVDAAADTFGGRVVIVAAQGEARRCLEITGVYERLRHPAERWAEP